MPIKKNEFSSHYNRDIFNLDSDIQYSIRKNTGMYLYSSNILGFTADGTNIFKMDRSNPLNLQVSTPAQFNAALISGGTF